jgi:hypothetical protein
MRCPHSTVLLVALGGCLAGCGALGRFVPPGGMAERCGRFMTEAFPEAAIDITKSEAAAISLTTIVAKVEGVRTNMPGHAALPPALAVECRFDNSVLTGFHWTKGPIPVPKISLRTF